MPTVVQFRRGTTGQNNAFTGAVGEISVDTDLSTLRVHDGATAGGAEIVNVSSVQTIQNKVFSSHLLPAADSIYDLGDSATQWRDLHLSGTLYGALSGNAATATALATARTIGGVSFDGSGNINLPGVNTGGNQNTTGSAAKLTTARTIGGVSFDGSANINLPGVNTTGNQNTSGNAATATALATGRTVSLTGDVTGTSGSFDGSGNVSITASLAANTITSSELSGATSLVIYNSAGTALKTLYGAGS